MKMDCQKPVKENRQKIVKSKSSSKSMVKKSPPNYQNCKK